MNDWPCQQLMGGKGAGTYENVDGRCKHPECNPKNDDRLHSLVYVNERVKNMTPEICVHCGQVIGTDLCQDLICQQLEKCKLELNLAVAACKLAYRKHHLNDLHIGWEELGDVLQTTLCECLGDEGFNKWLNSTHDIEPGKSRERVFVKGIKEYSHERELIDESKREEKRKNFNEENRKRGGTLGPYAPPIPKNYKPVA